MANLEKTNRKEGRGTKIPFYDRVDVRFIGFVILITFLSGAIISFATINISRNSIRQEVLNNNLTQANLTSEFTSNYVEVIQANIASFATRPLISVYINENNLEAATNMLQGFVQIQTVLDTCGLYDVNGIQLAISNPNVTTLGQSFADREWFQQAVATKQPYQSVPIKSRATGSAIAPYVAPILNEQGQVIGVFAGSISLAKLSDVLIKINQNPAVNYTIADTRDGGLILANENPQLILTALSDNNDVLTAISKGESGSFESTNNHGEKELISFAPLTNLPWGVIITTSSRSAFSSIGVLTQTASFLSIVTIIIASIMSGLFMLQITMPIRHLVEDTKEIGKGNLDHKIEIIGKGEIAELSRSFDDMTDNLKKVMITNESLDQRVQDRTSELEKSNDELESFTYSISHDLRAPLRHVHGFVDMLSNHLQGNTDEKSQHYLETISNAVKDMGYLIDDLLSFSRIGKTQINNVKIDLNLIVKDVIDSYQIEIESKNIKWEIEKLPVVNADINMIKLVFDNLISNALKFTSLKEVVTIEIGSDSDTKSNNNVEIYVKDNGAGFDMRYVEKLFGVFQRLHSQKEFEGTGIGLANVKRIVQKHGGRVWAEGLVDEGATFYFTLPKYKEK